MADSDTDPEVAQMQLQEKSTKIEIEIRKKISKYKKGTAFRCKFK